MTHAQNRDLIDSIADGLSEKERTAFYREMTYCRSLPENDELLRVLRVMQILTLLMKQVPERVAMERERLEKLLAGALKQLQKSFQASEASLMQLEQRLVQLPGFLAAGISPETIVAEINDKLRKEFARSTIPETAGRLGKTAEQIEKTAWDLDRAVGRLGNSYRGAMEEGQKTIAKLDATISRAAETASREATRLSNGFHQQYWWSVFLLTTVALFLGISLGMLLMQKLDQPAKKPVAVISAPASQDAPPIKVKTKK